MKFLVATILILSIFSFQFSDMLVYISFKINQDYIAKNLCIEKDLEGSTCKGCCQLKKKMESQQEQKEKAPPVQYNKLNVVFFMQNEVNPFLFSPPGKMVKQVLNNHYINCFLSRIFHPPRKLS